MSFTNLGEDCQKIIQPKNINIDLMEHQKTAIYAMIDLEKNGKIKAHGITQYNNVKNFNMSTNIGILADKVGAGKSLMMITLIELQKIPPMRDMHWSGVKYLSITEELLDIVVPTTLLIVPHKLINQWIKFFSHAPKIRIAIYNTDFKEDLKNYDVLLVTCTKVESFLNSFKNTRWGRIVVDEADSIKLPRHFEFNALFIWLVTATPKRLRHVNKSYLSKTFKDILPWVFDYIIVKNNNDFVEKSIILPPPKRVIIHCLTPREIAIIKNIIPKGVLSMINAGNTEDAIKLLNCNIDTNDNILKVVTNNIKEVIDNKKKELNYESSKQVKINTRAYLEKELRVKILKKCIGRLEERYSAIKTKIYNLNDQYCPICMDEFTKPTLLNCCQNVFCFECITLSMKNTNQCPFCRKKIYQNSFHIINDSASKSVQYEKKDKLDILLQLLNAANIDKKFMVFANYPQTFEKIKTALDAHKITYNILKGTADNIQKILDEFANSKIKVLMLNTKYFGAGMNLQMATDMVFYHRFENLEMEEQAIGRAQRLGRVGQLSVFYLLHDNEVGDFNPADKFEDVSYYDWLDNLADHQEQVQEQADNNKSDLLLDSDDIVIKERAQQLAHQKI